MSAQTHTKEKKKKNKNKRERKKSTQIEKQIICYSSKTTALILCEYGNKNRIE